MSKTKEQKRAARHRRIQKETHLRRNNVSKMRFRLDVEVDGKWRRGMMAFKTIEEVQAYVRSIEEMRKGTEVVHGQVLEVFSGKVVVDIAPSKPDPKGVLPGGEFVKPALE